MKPLQALFSALLITVFLFAGVQDANAQQVSSGRFVMSKPVVVRFGSPNGYLSPSKTRYFKNRRVIRRRNYGTPVNQINRSTRTLNLRRGNSRINRRNNRRSNRYRRNRRSYQSSYYYNYPAQYVNVSQSRPLGQRHMSVTGGWY